MRHEWKWEMELKAGAVHEPNMTWTEKHGTQPCCLIS